MWQTVKNVPDLTSMWKRPKRTIFGLVFVLVLAVWGLSPAAAQQSIPFADYLRLIGQANTRTRAAVGQSEAACSNTLRKIAAELTAVSHVQMPDGSVMSVNHAGADNILRVAPCNPEAASTYLAGICPVRICPTDEQPAELQIPSPGTGNPPSQSPGSTDPTQPIGDLPINIVPGGSSDASAPGNDTGGEDSVPSTTGVDTAVPENPPPPADTTENDTSSETGPGSEPGAEGTPGEDDPTAAETGSEGETAVDNPSNGEETGPSADGDPAADESGAPGTDGATGGDGTTSSDTSQPNPESDAGPSAAESDQAEGETAVPNPDSLSTDNPTTDEAAPDAETAPEEASSEESSNPEDETARLRNQRILIASILMVFLMALLIAVLLWRRRQAEDEARRKRQQKPASSAAAVEEGRRQIDEGDYREAVRQLFLATLLTLEERGILQYDRTLTNQELLQKMRTHPRVINILHSVVGTVERVWYGFEPLAKPEFEALVAEINTLQWTQAT